MDYAESMTILGLIAKSRFVEEHYTQVLDESHKHVYLFILHKHVCLTSRKSIIYRCMSSCCDCSQFIGVSIIQFVLILLLLIQTLDHSLVTSVGASSTSHFEQIGGHKEWTSLETIHDYK